MGVHAAAQLGVSFSLVCTLTKEADLIGVNEGFSRDHTQEFSAIRRKTVDARHLETVRLEKRLTKLTQLLTGPPVAQGLISSTPLWPIAGQKSQRRALEQSVVAWEDDAGVPVCPFCQQEFSNYSFRRHHCRLCGRVVCGDPRTQCSSEVGLDVATGKEGSLA